MPHFQKPLAGGLGAALPESAAVRPGASSVPATLCRAVHLRQVADLASAAGQVPDSAPRSGPPAPAFRYWTCRVHHVDAQGEPSTGRAQHFGSQAEAWRFGLAVMRHDAHAAGFTVQGHIGGGVPPLSTTYSRGQS